MTARRHMNTLGSAVMGICLAGVVIDAATAGEIKVSTVRIDLSDRQASAAMTLTNTGTEKTLVHLRAVSWNQTTGHDATDPTNDLIVNPPIAEIDAGARQLVRIGYAGKLQAANEKSYRLLIEEVPRRDREHQQVVETYLKISVPIFIAPLDKPQVRLSASLSKEGGGTVAVRNDGTGHTRLVSYAVTSRGTAIAAEHKGLFYILPGARVVLPLEPQERIVVAPGGIDILTDEGHLQLPLQATPE